MDLSRPQDPLQWERKVIPTPFLVPQYCRPGSCSAVLVGSKLVVTGRLVEGQVGQIEDTVVASAAVIDYEAGIWHWVKAEGPCVVGSTSYLIGDKVFSLGGLALINQEFDLWSLDLVQLTWEVVQMKEPKFIEKSGHSTVFVEELNIVVTFGGFHRTTRRHSAELLVLPANELSWMTPRAKGNPPAPTAGMGTAHVGRNVFLFGGVGTVGEGARARMLSSLYVLHCEGRMRFVWSEPITHGVRPEQCGACTLSYLQGHLIVFGGSEGGWQGSNELSFYDIKKQMWSKPEPKYQVRNSPPQTFGHSALMTPKGLLVVGGLNNDIGRYYLLRSNRSG